MSPIKGRANMNCRPAGFSDDDSDDGDDWSTVRTPKVQTKCYRNPQVEFETAIKYNDLEGVRAAFEAGASVRQTDSAGYTGLMLACSYGHSEIVKYLVKQRSQTDVCTGKLISPLMIVCFSACNDERRLLECAEVLIAECVNVNAIDAHGATALMFACKSGYCLLVETLIKNGANVHMVDVQKWSALHYSANAGNVKAVEILLAAGAKKGAKDAHGRRPFEIAMAKPTLKQLAETLCPKRLRSMLEPPVEDDYVQFQMEETSLQAFARKLNSIHEHLDNPRSTMKGKELNLYEFLTTTEEELEALGMKRSWHRKQTLEYIKAYLLKPWERLAQPRLSKFGQIVVKWNAEKGVNYKSMYPKLSFVNSAHLVIEVAKRLQIVQASFKYMEMHVNMTAVSEEVKQQMKLISRDIWMLELEVKNLLLSLESHDKEPMIPADLVMGQPIEIGKKRFPKCVGIVGVLSVLALATWRFKGSVVFSN